MKRYKLSRLVASKWEVVGSVHAKSRRKAAQELRGNPKKGERLPFITIDGEDVNDGCWKLELSE